MPAACRIRAKAPGFSGHAMISPALWISRTSAPSTSQGVSTSMPVFSLMSSSMNAILSFTRRRSCRWKSPPSTAAWSRYRESPCGAIPISMLKSLRNS